MRYDPIRDVCEVSLLVGIGASNLGTTAVPGSVVFRRCSWGGHHQ